MKFHQNVMQTHSRISSREKGSEGRTSDILVAIPHSTTGESPAEMLFHRKIKTKLSKLAIATDTLKRKVTQEKHDAKKLQQKHYFDKKHHSKAKTIEQNDKVLVKQEKTTIKPPFDPIPWKVERTGGNRMYLTRPVGSKWMRDINKVKKVWRRPERLVPLWEKNVRSTADYSQSDISTDAGNINPYVEWMTPLSPPALERYDTSHRLRINTHNPHNPPSTPPTLNKGEYDIHKHLESLFRCCSLVRTETTEACLFSWTINLTSITTLNQ